MMYTLFREMFMRLLQGAIVGQYVTRTIGVLSFRVLGEMDVEDEWGFATFTKLQEIRSEK